VEEQQRVGAGRQVQFKGAVGWVHLAALVEQSRLLQAADFKLAAHETIGLEIERPQRQVLAGRLRFNRLPDQRLAKQAKLLSGTRQAAPTDLHEQRPAHVAGLCVLLELLARQRQRAQGQDRFDRLAGAVIGAEAGGQQQEQQKQRADSLHGKNLAGIGKQTFGLANLAESTRPI
jgi:hypothetical protein